MTLGNITQWQDYAYVDFELEGKQYVIQFANPLNQPYSSGPAYGTGLRTRSTPPDSQEILYGAAKHAVSEFLMTKLFEESDALKKLKQ